MLSPISPAEQRILDALEEGERCLLLPPEQQPTPVEIAGWQDTEREVRAEFLRELLLRYDKATDRTEVDLYGAIIIGRLDLTAFAVARSLTLRRCLVRGDVLFDRTRFKRDISAVGCVFASAVRCEDTVFESETNFDSTHFCGSSTTFEAGFFGDAKFDKAEFAGTASFSGSVFYSDCRFRGTIFGTTSWFRKVQFCKDALFEEAKFGLHSPATDDNHLNGRADFSASTFVLGSGFKNAFFAREVSFSNTSFLGQVTFDLTVFQRQADFRATRFADQSSFISAVFADVVGFVDSKFDDHARFDGAVFNKTANFYRSLFTGEAHFEGAAFTGGFRDERRNSADAGGACDRDSTDQARFKEVIFTGGVFFRNVVGCDLDFSDAAFHSAVLVEICAAKLDLERAVFHERPRLTAVGETVLCRSVRLLAGGEVQVHAATIDLANIEFTQRCTVSGIGPAAVSTLVRSPWTYQSDESEIRNQARDRARSMMHFIRGKADASYPTKVVSLRYANIGDLTTLSDLDLTTCRFEGAQGLDKLRIDPTCRLLDRPASKTHKLIPLWFTHRHVLYEEELWRKHRFCAAAAAPAPPRDETPPPPGETERIYRDLRKRLEDVKDAPGAADFYYGEMEMRRLATRASKKQRADTTHRRSIREFAAGIRPGVAGEKWLLHLYWALSGYGLRASRALVALMALLAIATGVFATIGTTEGQAKGSLPVSVELTTGTIHYPMYDRSVGSAFWFSVRDGVALLRDPGPTPPLTVTGKIFDIVLRLAVPVLLGLAVLAIRGRIKR
ncbi:MAG: hypothetical protein QOE48_520 [Mycobacterium sp.]|jgi:uncharacterized protein YjbI with pentapeptide repeats|nr:hypothetical protein [Mycobacterium sp.]